MQKRIGVALLLGFCLVLLVSGAGCGGGEEYDMATDEEFIAALDEAAYKVAEEGASSTAMYEELAAAFSDRYAEADILDALQAKLAEVMAGIQEEKEALLEGEEE